MNIAILEDRPLVMRDAIEKLDSMGIYTKYMVCYDNMYNQDNEIQKKVVEMCEKHNIRVLHANSQNFDSVLDQVYDDADVQLLFDMDLLNDYSKRFEERINVIYANKKKEQENNNGRIWFYTSGPAYAVESINQNFKERNIPVVDFDTKSEQIALDYDFIEKKFTGNK